MSKERLKSPRARLFVALDLPTVVRSEIVKWRQAEPGDPALRPLVPEALHITLAFLGYQPEREIERLGQILEAASGAAPRIELRNPVARPERGRPRLFALPAESPAAMALQAALAESLAAERLYKPEKRPFWPHVTVARVRREERGSKRPALVSHPPGELPKRLLRPFYAVRAALYRSELRPQGAKYTPLVQVDLPKDGRQ